MYIERERERERERASQQTACCVFVGRCAERGNCKHVECGYRAYIRENYLSNTTSLTHT